MPAKSGKDIVWLAAMLEGEGSFGIKDNGTAASIKIGMKDVDIISRVSQILGCSVCVSKLKSGASFYIVQIYGDKAIQWMMTIYCLMGERRKDKIRSIIALWKIYEKQYKEFCIRGHRLFGDRICKECRKIAALKHQEKRRNNSVYREKHAKEEQIRRDRIKNEDYEIKVIKMIAKFRKVSLEEAKKVFDATTSIS